MDNTRMLKFAALAAFAAALFTLTVHTASAAPVPAFVLSTQSPFLPINPNNWVPVAFVAVLFVIAVAAFVYVLAGVINSSRARAWAQAQIYECIVSIVLLLIFLFFVYLFLLNPVPALNSAGLVSSSSSCGSSAVNTIFTLSACDMAFFNQNGFSVASTLYVIAFIAGFSPGIDINVSTEPPLEGIGVSASLQDFIPVEEEQILTVAFSGLFFAMILNQLQSIMVSSALLWLGLFLTVGLVARCFGITKTFGGSMIAFGLGLGLVYPLLVVLTYGFINVGTGSVNVLTTLGNILPLLATAVLAVISGQSVGAWLPIFNSQFVTQIAYVVAGLTFIPFLNFTILDAFIRDFSKAVGAQVDFMSLMGGLL